jgi:hypothetical protein
MQCKKMHRMNSLKFTVYIGFKTNQLMLCREIMVVCAGVYTKHINTLCEQNVEVLKVKFCGT